MKINSIQINHMEKPIGFNLSNLRIEFGLTDVNSRDIDKQLQIISEKDGKLIFDSGKQKYINNYFQPKIDLKPRTRYLVNITVTDHKNTETKKTYFETGKMDEKWSAKWISNPNHDIQNTLFRKNFTLKDDILSARLYISALGLYECYLNNQKVGDEFLTPGFTAYDKFIQTQTYDVSNMFKKGENELIISTADGWYKGNFGYDGGKDNIYGNTQMAIAELYITFKNGETQLIKTDNSWETTSGQVTKSAIYYGEDWDSTKKIDNWQKVEVLPKDTLTLKDRLSLPIIDHENLKPIKLINDNIIDFGQNHAGWIEFFNREPRGTKITFLFGEVLQNNDLFRKNLRHARAAFTYISDGKEGWVRPHFTYFGFRYVKILGNTNQINLNDYQSPVLFSNIKTTGEIKTDNKLVNKLFKNILWSQKSNFFDVPTDCPQRDERLGWTGDASIFSKTATLNMDVYEFFKKFAYDMKLEQDSNHGMMTMYAPAIGDNAGGSAVWGDAATFIPWNTYQTYGDPAILYQNYTAMKNWVNWVSSKTTTKNLWTGCFQFGDWIALDGEVPGMPFGKTDVDYIASIYYYASTKIVMETAKLLGLKDDEKFYSQQSQDILNAIRKEYFTSTGRLAIDTQTAYALALQYNIIPENQRKKIVQALVDRLHKDNDHLKTGFVGTPFILRALSENGRHDLAMKIFFNEDYPSWLYAVKMGATTVWERWNSILEDGTMNPQGMNSLNHYSIGAIMTWAYLYLLGLRHHKAGYQEIDFKPMFNYRIKNLDGHLDTSYGRFNVKYQLECDEKHTIKIELQIPFGTKVNVILPKTDVFTINRKEYPNGTQLLSGTYQLRYIPKEDYLKHLSLDTPVIEIMNNKKLVQEINKVSNALKPFEQDPKGLERPYAKMGLEKINAMIPPITIGSEDLQKIEQILKKY